MILDCYFGNRNPEITGTSSSPLGKWDSQKPFAAGNHYSSNAVFDKSIINKQTVGALDVDYTFDAVPSTTPTSDGINFYYLTSTSLIARRVRDGKLIYNHPYNVGEPRVSPAIDSDTLYFTSSSTSSLVAVDKSDGSLKWQLPIRGSGGCDIVVYNGLIICSSSCLPNVVSDGFPTFTEQGFVFTVKDMGTYGELVNSYPLCAPLLNVGDKVTSDSLLPSLTYTVIGTTSVDMPVSMYQFTVDDLPPLPATPGSSPIATVISFTQESPPVFSQAIWNSVTDIYVDLDRTNSFTKEQLIELWSGKTGTHVIWSFLSDFLLDLVQMQPNNSGLYFYKRVNEGDTIANDYDASGLNYWGNSVSGSPPSIDGDYLYFGGGQTHSQPFYERWLESLSALSYNNLKRDLNATIEEYLAGKVTLATLNASKDFFGEAMRNRSVALERSPRGAISYCDAVVRVKLDQPDIDFAFRTLPMDVHNFLDRDPDFILVGLNNSADGDVTSGIQLFPQLNKVATTPSSGLGVIIDLDPPTYSHATYIGPQGTNYQSTQSTTKHMYCVNPNVGQTMITRNGTEVANSFVFSFDVNTATVTWLTELFTSGASGSTLVNGCILTGGLYALDAFNGDILWYRYSDKDRRVAPCVTNGVVIYSQYGLTFRVNEHITATCEDIPKGEFTGVSITQLKAGQRWSGRRVNGRLITTSERIRYMLRLQSDGTILSNNPRVTASNLLIFNIDSYSMRLSLDGKSQLYIFRRR